MKSVRLPSDNALRICSLKGPPTYNLSYLTLPYLTTSCCAPELQGWGKPGASLKQEPLLSPCPKSKYAKLGPLPTLSSVYYHSTTGIVIYVLVSIPEALADLPPSPTPHGSAFPFASAPTLALVPQFRQLPFHRLHA